MIYNTKKEKEYKIYFYIDKKGEKPVMKYIEKTSLKEQNKILGFIELLKISGGYLDEPYSKHIEDKIRELRIDFSKNRLG
jgi:hypothetical protein